MTLAHAYRTGDLSFAYPLMRGAAPLIVTLLGIAFLREWPTPQIALGIMLISLGIVAIAFAQRGRHSPAAAGWALNAAIIAAHAGRRCGSPSVRQCARVRELAIFLEAFPFLAWIWLRQRSAAVRYIGAHWKRGIVGGAASLGAYGIVLWAMTRAPVAAVAALRETSVLFAALIGAVFLKEGLGLRRLAGAATVVAGVAALKL